MLHNYHSKWSVFLSYITILRLLNGIIAGVAAVCAIILSQPQELHYDTFIYVILAATFVSSHAMILNDVADREEDRINAPHRPIPSGKISVRTAVIYSIVIGLIALAFAIAIDVRENLYGLSVATAVIFGALLDLYDFKFKKYGFWGNIVIGVSAIALFVYGSLHTYLIWGNFNWVPIFIGVGAGLGNVGREIIKGIPDVEGDREAGVKTIAVRFGVRKAAIIADLFLANLVGFGLAAALLSDLYLPSFVMVMIIAATVLFLMVSIVITQNPKWAYATKEALLLIFLAYLIVFIADAIAKLVK